MPGASHCSEVAYSPPNYTPYGSVHTTHADKRRVASDIRGFDMNRIERRQTRQTEPQCAKDRARGCRNQLLHKRILSHSLARTSFAEQKYTDQSHGGIDSDNK